MKEKVFGYLYMETKTIQTASLDELGTKINELLQDNWYVSTDFVTYTIYCYKPIPERKQPVPILTKPDAKKIEKSVKATTQGEAILVNAAKLIDLETNDQARLQEELEQATDELGRATDPAGIDAATSKQKIADLRIQTNATRLIKALNYEKSAAENIRSVSESSADKEPNRSVSESSADKEPNRSVSESSASRSV